MFESFKKAFSASTAMWNFAGYWADVVIEYHNLTGWNLERIAKSSNDRKLLDEFCRMAIAKGTTAKACALAIYHQGFANHTALDQSPSEDAEEDDAADLVERSYEAQRRLTDEFAKYDLDFMNLHPTIHRALLDELLIFGRIERTVEIFFETAALVREKAETDDERARMLLEVWKARGEMYRNAGNK